MDAYGNRGVTQWPEPVLRALTNRDSIATGCEILRASMGFSLVPTLEKRPVMALSDDGRRRPETQDPRVWIEWSALWPDIEIGLVPGDRFGIIDVDQPDRAGLLTGLEGTFTEARGAVHRHAIVAVPEGVHVRPQAVIPNVGDWKALNQYCRMPVTPGYEVVDVGAPILEVPPTSPLWDVIAARRTVPRVAIAQPNAADRVEAQRVIKWMLQAQDPKMVRDVQQLLSGDTSGHRSPSEADYALAELASFHTHSLSVILAVMQASALWRPKWEIHRTYLDTTITKAIARRKELESGLKGETREHYVSYVARLFEPGETLTVKEAVVRFVFRPDKINGEGYCRLPMQAIADVCDVNRTTVWRCIQRLERDGLISTTVTTDEDRHGRGVNKRWARPAAEFIAPPGTSQ